jgi:hypothetical protein
MAIIIPILIHIWKTGRIILYDEYYIIDNR